MAPSTPDTPLSLLERIKTRDEAAWAEFAKKYVVVLERWCQSWNLQPSDSQDVVQETLLAVMTGIPGFERQGTGSFRAWMKIIAWRCWCDALAKIEKHRDQVLLQKLHDSPAAYQQLETEFEKIAIQELLETSISRVKGRVEEKTWDAFRMTALESRPAMEVAEKLSMSVDAIYAARCRVQRLIHQEYNRLDCQ